jgi:hypothetical protein
MPITINGSGTVTGISAGGLPDACITTADLADGAATPAKTTGGPAFSAYNNAAQTISNGTETKVILNTEEFDTASAFDSATNYRFTPVVAGYYQFNGLVRPIGSTTLTTAYASFWKNGANFIRGSEFTGNITSGAAIQTQANHLIYLNGSTDYVELYAVIIGTGALSLGYAGTQFTSRFSGFLARPA